MLFMVSYSEAELELATNVFEKYLESQDNYSSANIKAFYHSFKRAWTHAFYREPVLQVEPIYHRLNGLIRKVISSQEQIENFGTCLGALAGYFKYSPDEVLKEQNLFLSCCELLRRDKNLIPMFQVFEGIEKEWRRKYVKK